MVWKYCAAGIAVAVLLAGAGCSGTAGTRSGASPSAAETAPAPEEAPSLVGRWELDVPAPPLPADSKAGPGGEKSVEQSMEEAGRALAEGFSQLFGAMIRLDLEADQTFRLTLLMVPLDGAWSREGDELTLRAEKVMGLPPQQYVALNREDPQAKEIRRFFEKPIRGRVLEGGAALEIAFPGSESEPARFKRVPKEEPKPVEMKVSTSTEKNLLGRYTARIEVDEGALTAEQRKDLPFLRSIVDSMSLELRGDYTFSMNMAFPMVGDWSLDGDRLVLVVRGLEGMSPEGGTAKVEPDEQILIVQPDGSLLLVDRESDFPSRIILTKQ